MPTRSMVKKTKEPKAKEPKVKEPKEPKASKEPKAKKAPKSAVTEQQTPVVCVGKGAGITAGLEIWRSSTGIFLLQDTTPDGIFATDVATWNVQPPKRSATKKVKDAAVAQ